MATIACAAVTVPASARYGHTAGIALAVGEREESAERFAGFEHPAAIAQSENEIKTVDWRMKP
ncbi:MAG TPA: hypothetical protein VIB98_05125 [Gemmatimonadaceae bacterium]